MKLDASIKKLEDIFTIDAKHWEYSYKNEDFSGVYTLGIPEVICCKIKCYMESKIYFIEEISINNKQFKKLLDNKLEELQKHNNDVKVDSILEKFKKWKKKFLV